MKGTSRTLPQSRNLGPVRRAAGLVALGATAVVCLGLAGCKKPPPPPDPVVWSAPRADGCEGVYVVLPANYSLYVEEGLQFESGGNPEDLPVYCTASAANHSLETLELQAERVQHLWRVYQLEADWDRDVVRLGTEFRLTRPARIFSVEQSAL